ncbi:relaxin 3 precursor [Gallus gallus]|uniref:Relaxin 3 n=1 Tax=Gallus gallus TaxID=9031 RepID=B1AC67_CHICK|nr:relaxin 3 precursor [Gallus gallus]ACA25600.1 relaxin-like peptide locus B [Gallus gallus]QVY19145.1 relaxin 3-like [Gallus gallus]|eukprot:NP_001106671.1 relaxin 3 precursor [Gallus gallus]
MGAKLRLLCAAAALLSVAVPGQPGAQGALVPAGDGDGYGVKLCGREFIRAVIFTCGGSRWKRLSLMAMEPAPAADSSQAASNNLLGRFKMQSAVGPEMQRSNSFLGLETLKDLYSLNDYNEYESMADDFKELLRQLEEAAQGDGGGAGVAPLGPSSYPWARYPRRKRESLGLAGMCCKWGCTKAEISTICRV